MLHCLLLLLFVQYLLRGLWVGLAEKGKKEVRCWGTFIFENQKVKLKICEGKNHSEITATTPRIPRVVDLCYFPLFLPL